MFGTLQHILYMYEDIFCWHIYSKIVQTFQSFFKKFGEYLCKMPPKKVKEER